MIPRLKLDVSWLDIFSFWYASWKKNLKAPEDLSLEIKNKTAYESVAGLSNRTLFDALLQSLDLNPGDEVLMSALTIQNMADIVKANDLVPIPVDIEMKTLAPRIDEIAKYVSAKTKVLVIAPLFGGQVDMQIYQEWCDQHGIILIEDIAQAFDGEYFGAAEIRIMSFGPIKARTAFAGGILLSTDFDIVKKVQQLVKGYPSLPTSWYRRRILKMAFLKFLTIPFIFGIVVKLIMLLGKDPDTTLGGSAKGFSGDLLVAIRNKAPDAVCLAMLRRIRQGKLDDQVKLKMRSLVDEGIYIPGALTPNFGSWLFPVISKSPKRLVTELRKVGVDATQGSSSMKAIAQPDGRGSNKNAEIFAKSVVYLPHCQTKHFCQLIAVVQRVEPL